MDYFIKKPWSEKFILNRLVRQCDFYRQFAIEINKINSPRHDSTNIFQPISSIKEDYGLIRMDKALLKQFSQSS